MEFKGKKCHEEPRDKTGIEAQTYWRTELRIWGGGMVSFDRARESHGHIHTNKCSKVDSKGEAAARHRDISSGRWDSLEGWKGERGREGDTRGKTQGAYVYV